MKLITKTDESGNTWLLLGKLESKPSIDFSSAIRVAISSGKITAKRATASEIAVACNLDSSRKPVIDAVAKTMRLMGYEERRRGTGKYFLIPANNDNTVEL